MHEEKIKRLYELKRASESGGGEEKIAAQHAKGKLTARERIDLLMDPMTFVEIDKYVTHRGESEGQKYHGDGVITGFGLIG